MAKNERVIFGDDGDVSGGANCFHPDPEIQKKVDDYLLHVARERRKGRHVV